MSDPMSMEARVASLPLALKLSKGEVHSATPDGEIWLHTRYRVTLTNTETGARMSTRYSMGSGHGATPPTLAEVVHSLTMDSQYANESFEDWAGEYDYDRDSRKAERTWKACRKVRAKMIELLGADALDALLYETESM